MREADDMIRISRVEDVLFNLSYGFDVQSVQCFAWALLAIHFNSAIEFKHDISVFKFNFHSRDGRDYADWD